LKFKARGALLNLGVYDTITGHPLVSNVWVSGRQQLSHHMLTAYHIGINDLPFSLNCLGPS